jgi:DNA-binding response OmpR family regulator
MWRILVVDDDENVGLVVRHGLQRLPDCTVSTATTGRQGLDLFEQGGFDLLIVDYCLGDMDGLTLAIQARQLCPALKVLMLTAYVNLELQERAETLTIGTVLAKPSRLADIRQAVIALLNRADHETAACDPLEQARRRHATHSRNNRSVCAQPVVMRLDRQLYALPIRPIVR